MHWLYNIYWLNYLIQVYDLLFSKLKSESASFIQIKFSFIFIYSDEFKSESY